MSTQWTSPFLVGTILFLSAPVQALPQGVTFEATRGLASSFPIGVIVGGEAALTGGVRVKPVGDRGGLPPLFDPTRHPVGTSQPDFSAVREHPHQLTVPMDIDAHSTGNARMPRFGGVSQIDTSVTLDPGVPNLGLNQWYSIAIGLDGTAANSAGTSFFNNPLNEVVSYYFRDNNGVDPIYADGSLVDLKRANLGFNGHPDRYLKAMDYGIGFITFDTQTMSNGFFDYRDRYYFSVTPTYASNFNTASVGYFAATKDNFGIPEHPAHPGDVYRRVWDGTTWGFPEIFFSADELGMAINGDIDAIDLNPDNEVIVFSVSSAADFVSSLTTVGEQSQIMVFQREQLSHPDAPFAVASTAVRDRTSSGTDSAKVTERVGIRDIGDGDPDNIELVCQIDPEPTVAVYQFGTPLTAPDLEIAVERMGMSISHCKTEIPAGMPGPPGVHVQLTGWGGHAPHKAELYLFARKLVPAGPGPWQSMGTYTRNVPDDSHMFSLAPDAFGSDSSYEFFAYQVDTTRTKKALSVRLKMTFE